MQIFGLFTRDGATGGGCIYVNHDSICIAAKQQLAMIEVSKSIDEFKFKLPDPSFETV